METATPLSKTVKLSNEELGGFHRRVYEIVRRVENGNVPFVEAMTGLQRVIERTQMPEVRYSPRAEPQKLPILRRSERRRSTARLSVRLPHSFRRLSWPERNPERIIAELWEIECIPEPCSNSGRTPVHAIMGEGVVPTERDIQIINSTIQYLGTNCGMVFVRKFLGVSGIYVN